MLGQLLRWITKSHLLPSHLVISINTKILCLAEKDDLGSFALSYFVKGSYGNYLIGIPLESERFDRIFQGQGGIKYMFSLSLHDTHPSESREADAARWIFQRYGAYLIADKKPGPTWDLPVKPLEQAGINDLKIEKTAYGTGIKITAKDFRSFFVNPSVASGGKIALAPDVYDMLREDLENSDSPGPGFVLYPSHLIGDPKTLKPIFQGRALFFADPSLREMRSRQTPHTQSKTDENHSISWPEIEAALLEQKFIFHFDKESNSLALYDDVEFERNDYEIIPPISRKQITQLLSSLGYKLGPGRVFSPAQNEAPELVIPPSPRSLMSGLLDMLETVEVSQIKIVTPTQQAALIAQSGRDDRDERMLSLASTLPFNYRKLIDFCRAENIDQQMILTKAVKSSQVEITQKMRKIKPKGCRRRV